MVGERNSDVHLVKVLRFESGLHSEVINKRGMLASRIRQSVIAPNVIAVFS
jgi:hypothetical protein